MPAVFLDLLGAEFGIEVPREDGLDSVDTLRAWPTGRVHALIAVGGNVASVTPDTAGRAGTAPLRAHRARVHQAQPLARHHRRDGADPADARADQRDVQATGEQFVTVEDSMSVVHSSRGSKDPAADTLRSEVAIVSGSPGHCSARSIRCAGKCLPRTTT